MELVRDQPLRHGLAELVAYLSLTDESFRVVFDESRTEQLRWHDPDGREQVATLPRVTFARARTATSAGGR